MEDAERIRNRHVAFLASFHDPGIIFEQLSIIYHLPRLFVASFTLVLPYFSTGTAERVGVWRVVIPAGMGMPDEALGSEQFATVPPTIHLHIASQPDAPCDSANYPSCCR